MKKLIQNTAAAWCLFALVIVLLVVTFRWRTQWWMFIDVFFAFMMSFCHLMAVTLRKLSAAASRKLDIAAVVFAVAFLVSFVVLFFVLA